MCCWSLFMTNMQGRLVANSSTFPSGIKALADYVHSKGLKLGIYSDAGYEYKNFTLVLTLHIGNNQLGKTVFSELLCCFQVLYLFKTTTRFLGIWTNRCRYICWLGIYIQLLLLRFLVFYNANFEQNEIIAMHTESPPFHDRGWIILNMTTALLMAADQKSGKSYNLQFYWLLYLVDHQVCTFSL